jgi:hypothetical protein
VTVPKAILSNRFDCPYKPARCADWDGWRFEKGPQHMDGRRALVYSRIRSNQLDPSDSDITRGNRQQIVADAVGDEIASVGTFLRLPFMGGELAAPLATDLSAWQLAQLGWALRSGARPAVPLGDPSSSAASPCSSDRRTTRRDPMWLGRRPHSPPKGTLYGAAVLPLSAESDAGFGFARSTLLGRLVGRFSVDGGASASWPSPWSSSSRSRSSRSPSP